MKIHIYDVDNSLYCHFYIVTLFIFKRACIHHLIHLLKEQVYKVCHKEFLKGQGLLLHGHSLYCNWLMQGLNQKQGGVVVWVLSRGLLVV